MSGLRGLVKIRKDGEPRLTIRRQEGGGRRQQTGETGAMLIATIVVHASSGVGINRNECKCGDEDDRGSGECDGTEVGTWPPGDVSL
ncbi:hypothetical protein BS50DRAFT_579029 [Corynespora cassiicola Philippines]|uniref:Uncharacterized protein n=1 Tax=Corynespora cassiicola Philippines TaxID=1448308 RepID=A0A2T2N647_CORCC|nr:hypothetical protein BS50DRAFT_579029 [Corynespora cassiicola Philippines]